MNSSFISFLNPKLIIRFGAVVMVWVFFDSLIDLTASLLHALAVMLHYLFELLEHSLDALIEHVFHTDPHTTEIIVFYLLATVFGGIVFALLKALPRWYCKICASIIDYWETRKRMAIKHWQEQTVSKKLKWGSMVITSSMVMLFLTLS